MNLLEMICCELDIQVEEGWLGSDGYTYSISRDGTLWQCMDNNVSIRENDIRRVLVGELRPILD